MRLGPVSGAPERHLRDTRCGELVAEFDAAGVAAVRYGARRGWQSDDIGCGDPTAQRGVVACREGE